jgi:hypothetical protein
MVIGPGPELRKSLLKTIVAGISILAAVLILLSAFPDWLPSAAGAEGGGKKLDCTPTPKDALGPFYEPNAPLRAKVGEGYVLTGQVKSAVDCSPVSRARIEFWLAAQNRHYDGDHRATVYSGNGGEYRFESNFPPPYMSRPSHIHVRVSAKGYGELVTQHYPAKGGKGAKFDLVIEPAAE